MASPHRSNVVRDDREALGDAYREAGSIAELAGRVGGPAATVRRALVRQGIARFPRSRRGRTAVGWTVTVVQRSTTATTVTPDLRWDRLVVTTCGDVVDEITFD